MRHLIVLVLGFGLAACGSGYEALDANEFSASSKNPNATPTPGKPTPTPSNNTNPAPTATPRPSATPRPTATPVPTPTPTGTPLPWYLVYKDPKGPPVSVPANPSGSNHCVPMSFQDSNQVQCYKQTGSEFYPAMNASIEYVIRTQPHLFDLNDEPWSGSYLVLNEDDFNNAITSALQAYGFCAIAEHGEVGVAWPGANYIEYFDIHLSNNHIWRGPNTLISGCEKK